MKVRLLGMLVVLGWALTACGGSGANQQPDPTDPPPAPQGVVQGTILSASGDPVADAQVVLQQVDLAVSALSAQAVGLGTTDSAGQFGVDVPSAGTYSLVMVQNGLGVHTTVDVVEQAGGLTASELDLTATVVGAVEGHVVYPDGSDAVNVLVFLEGTSFLALTDATGDFVISGVPAGSYTLVAKEAEYASSGQAVSVASGGTTSLGSNVELTDITQGPIITSIDPTGYVGTDRYRDMVGSVVTISGSGFGSQQNSSLLYYAGYPVASPAIVSWTDTEIRVEWQPADIGPYSFNSPDLWRYEVRTIEGTAISDPLVFFEIFTNSFWNSASGPALDIYVGRPGGYMAVPVDLAIDRGALESTSITTLDTGMPITVGVNQVDLMPHIVTLTSGGHSIQTSVVCCQGSYFTFNAINLGLPSTISGVVVADDGVSRIANASGFSLVLYDSTWSDEGPQVASYPVTTDANGAFDVTVTLPEPTNAIYRAELQYSGVVVADLGSLSVNTDLFSVSTDPSALTVAQGGTVTTQVTVTPSAGFSEDVGLTFYSRDFYVGGVFDVNPVLGGNGTSTLTLSLPIDAPLGTYSWQVSGYDRDGREYRTPIEVTITAP